MAKADLKKQLHDYIDKIEDENQLEILREAAETYAAAKQPDIVDALTGKQLKRLELAIKEADTGRLTPHEDVIAISKQWLTT